MKENRLFTLVIFFLAISSFFNVSYAQTNTWDGSANNNWGTAANWSLNLVPTAAHDVVIPNNFTVDINVAAVCNTFTIEGGNQDTFVDITGTNSLTVTGAITINAGTGFGDNKTLTVGAGTVSCASIDVEATGSLFRTSGLTISTGTVNVTGDITMGDGNVDFTFTDAGTLNVGGAITGGTFTASTSTVDYNGNNQTINSDYTYNNLTFSGSGDASFDGDVTIGGDFEVNTVGTLDFGTNTLSITGDWTNDGGTLDLSTSTIDLNGAAQTIGGTNSTTFNDLTLSGSGTKTFAVSTAIGGTLNIGNGIIADLGTFTDHSTNALSLGNVGQAAGTWGSTTSAAVNQNNTYFAATTGIITAATTGPTTYFSRQTGNWNSAATWSTVTYGDATNNGTFPQAGDIVNIGGATLTVTVNVNAACGSVSFLENDGNSPTLAIGAGNTLDVSGGISIPRTPFFSGEINTLAVGDGTLNAASLDFSGGGFLGETQMTINTGTATFSGDVTTDINLFFPVIEFTGAGLLQVGGDFFEADIATLTPGTGTIEYNGSGDQSVSNFTYNNLILSGSGNKTAAGALDVDGSFTLGSGVTFTGGSFDHAVAGDWINNGVTFASTGTTITMNGTTQSIGGTNATTFNNLTIDGSTTTFNFATTINASIDISNGGVANLGTFTTHSSKTLSFDGGGQIPGTWGSTTSAATNTNDTYFAATTGEINVTNTIYYARQTGNWNVAASWSTVDYGNATNTGTFPSTGDIARIGGGFTTTVTANADCSFVEFETGAGNTNTLTINTGVSLTVADAVVIGSADGDTNNMNVGAGTLNTVDLIFNPAFAAGAESQLTISTGTATVTGDATNNGPDFLGIRQTAFVIFTDAGLLQLAGGFLDSDDGDLTAGTGTIEYNGSSPQTIADFTYYNLTFNNTASSTPALTLPANTTVTNALTMTSGILDMAGFTLTLGNAGASTLTRTASATTNWMYDGTLSRYWPASTAVTSASGDNYGLFPMGTSTASSYRPVEFNSTVSQTGAGVVTVSHTDFAGTTALSPVYDDGGTNIEVKDNSSFDVTNASTGGTYDVSVTMTGLSASGTLSDIRLGKNIGSTTVTAVGTHVASAGSASNPTAIRTGVTSAEIAGDWRIVSTDIDGTPLPVELLSFTGAWEGSYVALEWTTLTETNNDYFEVERSLDGTTFKSIGTVHGNGTSDQALSYAWNDPSFHQGINYYRLRQVDYDGTSEYLKTIAVDVSDFLQLEVLVYPNPVKDQLSLKLEGAIIQEAPALVIYNYAGKKVYQNELISIDGTWTARELDHFIKPGTYVFNVVTDRVIKSGKLVFER